MADHVVRSPVAGMVWKIEAEIGAALDAGATVMILESMKMEIPITAPAAGTLAELPVAEGDQISEDQVLARIQD